MNLDVFVCRKTTDSQGFVVFFCFLLQYFVGGVFFILEFLLNQKIRFQFFLIN